MQVAQWGNSLAVRLPAGLVRKLRLKAGDEIDLIADGPGKLRVALDPRKAELLRQMREANWELPADYNFDREEANAR